MANKQTMIEIPVSPERTISLTKEEAKVLQRELNQWFDDARFVRNFPPNWELIDGLRPTGYECLNEDAPTQHGE